MSTKLERAAVKNTSARTVVVDARDVDQPAEHRFYSIEPGGSVELIAVDAVALAQNRDYLEVSDVAPGEVLDPAISGVALGEYAGHDTVAASEVAAGEPVSPGTTVIDDRHTKSSAAAIDARGEDGDGTPINDDGRPDADADDNAQRRPRRARQGRKTTAAPRSGSGGDGGTPAGDGATKEPQAPAQSTPAGT